MFCVWEFEKKKKNITQPPNANIAGCASDISLGKFGLRCICGAVCNIDNFCVLAAGKREEEEEEKNPSPPRWVVGEVTRRKEARRSDERHNIYGLGTYLAAVRRV